MNKYADMLYFLHELISKYGMDKRILTTKFQFYTNVNLKLFSLLVEISFFKERLTFDFFDWFFDWAVCADIDPELIWWLIFLIVNFPQFNKISVLI